MTAVTSQSQLEGVALEDLWKVDYVEIPGVYSPSAWQIECHSLRTDEALGAGAAGPGKSVWLLNDVTPHILVAEELCRRGIIRRGECQDGALHVRRLSTGLTPTIRRSRVLFRALFGDRARWNENDGTWTFPSGYTFKFGHCKNPDDYLNYYSQNFTHIAYDELPELEAEQYHQLNTRIRSSDPTLGRMLKSRAACNPAPGWVRDYFYDPSGHNGRRVLKKKVWISETESEWHTRIYIPATIDDNPDKVFVRRYKKQLASKPKHIAQALLYGNWYVVVGAYFADHWRPDLHVIRPFQIPGDWPRFRSMDWGYKSPGCCLWWAVDPDGNLICTKEYTFSGKDGRQVAETIKQIEQGMGVWGQRGSKLSGPADTNLWGDWGQSTGADTHAAKMAKVGVNWVKADKRSRQMNAERLLARLDSHRHGTTHPGIMWYDTCQKSIETIPTIPADRNDSTVPEKMDRDHHLDAAVYACAYHTTTVAKLQERIKARKARNLDEEERYFEERDRPGERDLGRLGYGARY